MAAQNAIAILVQGYSTEQGSDPGQFLSDLFTNLQQAHRCTCFKSHERPLHYLLAHGSEDEITWVMKLVTTTEGLRNQVLEENSEQRNILHEAACYGTTQAIRAVAELLTEDSIVHLLTHIDCDHETPLEAAAFLEKVENFEALLQIIPQHRKLEVVEYLHHGREFPTMLHLFASDNLYNPSLNVMVTQLKNIPVYPEFTQPKGTNTPFHLLVERDNSDESLKAMLQLINPEKHQLSLAQANQNGDTALHIAVDKGKLSVMKSFCGTTAKEAVGLLQARDHNDNTPLHRAAKLGEQTHADFLDYVVLIIKPGDSIELLLNLQGENRSVINTAFKTNHPQFAKRCLNYLGRAIKLQSKQANNLSNNEHLIELVVRKVAYGHQKIVTSFMQLNKPAEQLVLFLLLAHLAKKEHQNIEPGQREIEKLIPEMARLASEIEARITKALRAIIGEDLYQKNFLKWEDGLRLLYIEKLTKEKERSCLLTLLDVLLPFLDKDDLKQDALSWTNSRSCTILHIAAEIGHTEAIDRLAWFGQWEFVVEKDRNALKNLTNVALESDYGMARDVKEATVKQLESFGLTRLDKYLQPLESKTLCLIFYSKKERARWEEELKSMEQFCSKLGITPMLKEMTSATRMLDLISAAKRFTPSCLMVVLLCHGGGGRIEMEDVVFPLREVVDAMAKDFHFVPKVLIAECCMTTTEAEKMPEDQRSEVEIHSDVAHHIQHSMTVMDMERIDKLFTKYKRPANLNVPVPQKAKEARAHNPTHSAMQHSMCKSVYVVGEIADEANRAYHVGPDEDVPVEVVKSLKGKAEHAISLIGHAYQHLIENNVELCNHHCYRLHSTDSNTISETNRGRDGYIRCGHMFEELPRHFLCLLATTKGKAERLLMASKLKERAGKKTEEGNLVDLEELFRDVRRRTATDSTFVQTPITASTLTKRLCLKLKGEDSVSEQPDD